MTVSGWSSNIRTPQIRQWYEAYVWVKNTSNRYTPPGLKVVVKSRNPNVRIYGEGTPMSQLAPGQEIGFQFWLATMEYGDYSDNVFDVTIVDSKNEAVSFGSYKVPIGR